MSTMLRRLILAAVATTAAGLAPAQDAQVQPAAVRMSDLPKMLDHEGTIDDAVPDERGVKRSIVMGGLDKITARTFRFEAPVGYTVRFKKLMITPRTCHVRPPEETPETSVFVQITELQQDGGDNLQSLFAGWMFASSPGLNALEHPVYDVWVIGCHVQDPNDPGAPTMPISHEDDGQAEKPSIDDNLEQDDGARE